MVVFVCLAFLCINSLCNPFKGIFSRDFEWLQTILINRLCVPDVPLEVYSFLNLHLITVFQFLSLQRVKLLLRHLAKT